MDERVPAVVVVLAAGAGRRMGADEPKAFLTIGGRPILSVAAAAAAASPSVGSLVIAAPPGWEDHARGCVEFLGESVRVVTGGDSRQASVRTALDVLPADVEFVAIHDAARPFAPPDLFTDVLAAVADGADGAVPVVPVADTVKRVRDGMIAGTLAREELGLAQTPQAFAVAALRESHDLAARSGMTFTDDAAVLELAGRAVRAVAGDPMNFKITTLLDLARAEERMRVVDA